MEENGSYTYLDILFQCRSLGELLGAMDDISEIMNADRRLYEQYKAAREDTERSRPSMSRPSPSLATSRPSSRPTRPSLRPR